ncbi:MAG: hypothetical protein A3J74_04385 [Elusimicrobia bacterium RIFCSPHIGHO2_02_FULL_57_9]|nr:MAG: hypothetical protein A3J74_04385 [Elusimicrobia bacterium RIFCSPHIGHO2_02_FULL_57_9]
MDTNKSLANKYETVFCLFMAAMAYLWRDNPNLSYPYILYLFLALLTLNLAEAGLMSSSLAHDLNNTFMTILGWVEIATQHEGRLAAGNKPGGGARFELFLPLRLQLQGQELEKTAAPA